MVSPESAAALGHVDHQRRHPLIKLGEQALREGLEVVGARVPASLWFLGRMEKNGGWGLSPK